MLMQELVELNEDFEKSEAKKNEMENQIDIMRSDLLKAQGSLSRLEQFETEKVRLKEELEIKIEEFNMLTDHYQHEKESYLHVLEHVQDQVNIYKEKSQQFDAEKGSWSKQIDELKAELMQTKATLVRMDELEQKNEQLTTELQSKEVEIYKIKKENERALNQQLEQFKSEMKLYQDKITQYEKDREMWEKQMKQMKNQFAALESNLEEKENFIKQFIKQPPSQSISVIQPSTEQTVQMSINTEEPIPSQNTPAPQTNQQPSEWFMRTMSQQQGTYQPIPQNQKSSNSSTMDFFTLRNKTTQSPIPGAMYGNQWNQE